MRILPEQEIISKYNNKESVISLSKQYNCGQGVIKRLLQSNNIHIRKIRESVADIYIPDIEKQNVIDLYNQGKSVRDISKIYKCKRSTILSFMKTFNIKRRNGTNPVYPLLLKNKKHIIKLYNKTENLLIIAKIYNCVGSTIADFLDKENISRRKNGNIKSIPIKDKHKLYDLHWNKLMTMYQLGKIYNVGPCTMATFFDKNNIKRRDKAETSCLTAQNPEVIKKQKRSLFTHKPYKLPSGKIIKIQGYEPQFLDYIFENKLLKEDEIDYEPKRIEYFTPDNKRHYYFPDFYIPKQNIVVEIKSTYILNKQTPQVQQLKEQATLKSGYNYCFILDNDFSQLKQLIIPV